MVQCAECGFLGVRRKTDFELVEADEQYRQTGTSSLYEAVDLRAPICGAGAEDLKDEAETFYAGRQSEARAWQRQATRRSI